jgi:hypothetical protein
VEDGASRRSRESRVCRRGLGGCVDGGGEEEASAKVCDRSYGRLGFPCGSDAQKFS